MDEQKKQERELENFWNKINKLSNDECWVWKGANAGKKGKDFNYGTFTIWRNGKKKTVKSHRYMWELINCKEIPAGMWICHKCDHPPCCNPNHLFLGTPKDNARDRDLKERRPTKLSWEKARSIRTECNLQEIADKYGISPATVYEIIANHRWIE